MSIALIPPISARGHEPFCTENEWLIKYFEFRIGGNTSNEEAQKVLSKMGKPSGDVANRFRGCLIGLATGDAFGTTLEFGPRRSTNDHTHMIGGGPFNLKPGQWTDDTSMALCIAYSLISKRHFDPSDIMTHFLDWRDNGLFSATGRCFDIGNTINQALQSFMESNNPYSGPTDSHSSGNGALMRLCPVPLFYASNENLALDYAARSSRLTHGTAASIDACRYFSALIIGAVRGATKAELLSKSYAPTPDTWIHNPLCEEVSDIANGSFKEKNRDGIQSTGYVIHSLEAALWAFYNTDTFAEGLILAVNLGGDADTIGAIYGQIAGAHYGETAIPFDWIQKLTHVHYFYYFAEKLLGFYHG